MTDQVGAMRAAPGAAVPSAEFSVAYRNYALFVLMMAYTANFVDRQILSILLQPIKLELGLSDTQLGFLSGLTFALFYATLGIPIAMWADRFNRRNIVSMALTIFSGMTIVCGYVTSFGQLALARIGVGVGEAGSSPLSHSMIADMFPPEKRASAMGIYSMGINLGILVGGWVSQWYGWRAAMPTGSPLKVPPMPPKCERSSSFSGRRNHFASLCRFRPCRPQWLCGGELASRFPHALLLFIFPAFAGTCYIAPSLAMTQAVVIVRMRAQASAILFLILNLIGMGLGAQLAGILSDALAPTYGDESLRYALLIISVVSLWAAVHFIVGGRTLKADIERARPHGLK